MSANTVARSRDCAHARGLLHLEKGSELIDSRGRRPQVTSWPRSIGLHGPDPVELEKQVHHRVDRDMAVARVNRGRPRRRGFRPWIPATTGRVPATRMPILNLASQKESSTPAKPSPRVLTARGIDSCPGAGWWIRRAGSAHQQSPWGSTAPDFNPVGVIAYRVVVVRRGRRRARTGRCPS
jgi:hypothetical protein